MEVQVGFGGMAGISAFANLLSDADRVARGHGNAALAQMGEKTEFVLPMLDQDVVPRMSRHHMSTTPEPGNR